MRTLLNYWQYSVEALRLKRTTGRENLATGVARLLPPHLDTPTARPTDRAVRTAQPDWSAARANMSTLSGTSLGGQGR